MIIGISGKIGSGKDLVGQIMQVISCDAPDYINTDKIHDIKSVLNWLNSNEDTPWEEMMFPDHKVTKNFLSKHKTVEIRKFADKLKDIVCLLIGCTREQLEDREFKEKELGEEWWYFQYDDGERVPFLGKHTRGTTNPVIKLTPRKLLQLLGTECGRQIIHPNIWVNALFASYLKDSNWVVTDVRFPNEAQAIKDKGGIVIRVERNASELERCLRDPVYFIENYTTINGNKINLRDADKSFILEHFTHKEEHPSETALDNYKFDEVIENNGSIEELIEKVKKLNII